MISGAIIDALVAAGCSAEQVAAAVKADMAADEVAIEAKRAKERERKRLSRAKESVVVQECPDVSVDVRGQPRTDAESADSVDNGFSLSPVPLLSPIPPNNPLTPKPSSKNSKTRAHRLPETAEISGPDLAYGLSRGLTDRETCDLWQRMASWAWSAGGSNALKINWHQAFQGWVQRDGLGIIAARRSPTGKPLTAYQQKQQESKDAIAGLENFATGSFGSGKPDLEVLRYDPGRPGDLRSGSGGDVVDLSPSGHRSFG